ncbi:MAG: XRE family transcriptional regulator [Sciscionella sp.]
MGEGQDSGERSLADKLNKLFATIRRADGAEHSNEEVATWCKTRSGESFSRTYLWQLRAGKRTNPTLRHLGALAAFFDMPLAYFGDDEQAQRLQHELDLLAALRHTNAKRVALRAVDLSADGTDAVLELIDEIMRQEEEQSGGAGLT